MQPHNSSDDKVQPDLSVNGAEDTENMNRERAETHLRLVAEPALEPWPGRPLTSPRQYLADARNLP